MSTSNPSYLTEASSIASKSINAVNVKHSLILGCIVFVIGIIVSIIVITKINKSSAEELTYDQQGCQLDDKGARITMPIYAKDSRGNYTDTVVGHDKCVTATPTYVKYLIGMGLSLLCAVIIGSFLYKIQFMIANPKVATGIFATRSLFGD